jgi:beta-glucosidase
VSATIKHFAAFASPEQGLNTGPVHGGERELRTTYLPSYKRAIIDAGAYSIMTAYSSYDGVPLIANYHILTEILREEWGYKYWTTSDAGATDRLCNGFKMCSSNPTDQEAVTLYVNCSSPFPAPETDFGRLSRQETMLRWEVELIVLLPSQHLLRQEN